MIGASTPRRDIPPKVSGTPIFVHDLDFDGMLHGRVVRPPSYRRAARGARRGERPGHARRGRGRARRQLPGRDRGARGAGGARAAPRPARGAQWEESAELPDDAIRASCCRSRPRTRSSAKSGDAAAPAARVQHARGGVHAAVHRACRDRPVVRGSELRRRRATRLDAQPGHLPAARAPCAGAGHGRGAIVVIAHVDGAGCYGHNGADDVALDAALLARAVPGRPVRVQWMREDEFTLGAVRPGDGRAPQGRARRRREHRELGRGRVEQRPHLAAEGRRREPGGSMAPGAARSRPHRRPIRGCPAAAAIATRFRSTTFRTSAW